jgi:hypothetical protein
MRAARETLHLTGDLSQVVPRVTIKLGARESSPIGSACVWRLSGTDYVGGRQHGRGDARWRRHLCADAKMMAHSAEDRKQLMRSSRAE